MRCVVALLVLLLAAGSFVLPAGESSAQEIVTPPELNFPDFPPLAPATVKRSGSKSKATTSRSGSEIVPFQVPGQLNREEQPRAATLREPSIAQVPESKLDAQAELSIEPPDLAFESLLAPESRYASAESLSAELRLIPRNAPAPPLFGRTQASISQLRVETDVPQLRVSTIGPDTLVVGKSAEYEITITNHGDFDSRGILVRSTLPSSVRMNEHAPSSGTVEFKASNLEWMVDQVIAGASETLSLNVTPNSGEPFDLNVDVAVQPQQSRSQILVQSPELLVELEGSENASFGAPSMWRIKVSNPGTGDAENVHLDLLSSERSLGTKQLGTISAGDHRSLELTLSAEEVGRYALTAKAQGDVNLADEASSEFVVRRGEISLQLSGTEMEYAGGSTTYEVTVRNSGDEVVRNALVSLSFPMELKYEHGLEAPNLTPGGVSWPIERLECNQELRFPIRMKILDGGVHRLNLTASAESCLATTDTLTTEALTSADLKLEVVDPKGPRPLGASEVYKIHVINQGTDVARDIRVVAVCAPEVEPVDVSGNAVVRAGQVFFKPIVELAPDHKVTFEVSVQARKPGAHAFRVVLKCHEPKLRLASEESTRFFERITSTRSNSIISQSTDTDSKSVSRADQLNR